MAGTRTLKLSILADVDNLTRNLKQGESDVETFGDKIGKFGKMAGAAFLAAGAAAAAYAGKLAIDGVKAAIEDEAAQQKLALTLMNVAGATDEAIASTEDWITQQGILYGVTDDELRPAIERMTRATKDVTKAQDLVALAMDISAGTGKSLESVTNALGKAYEGSNTALGKLGLGIDKTRLSSMTFEEVTQSLANTFGGQATAKAETFAGQMQRLKVAFDEGKETVGTYILSAITPMVTTFVEKVIPAIQNVANNLGGKEGLQGVFERVKDFYTKSFGPILDGLKSAWDSVSSAIIRNKDDLQPLFNALKAFGEFAMNTLAPAIGKTLGGAFNVIGTAIGKAIDIFADMVTAANKVYNAIKRVIDLAKTVGSSIGNLFGAASFTAPTTTAPTAPTMTNASFRQPTSSTTNNITVNGAIDAEGTARTIYQVLQNSAARTGNYGTLGTSLNSLINA